MIRLSLAAMVLLLALAAPARAGWSLAYAPGTNLERFDAALLGRARRSIDKAAYVLTDVPVIDVPAAAGARGVQVRLYRKPEGFALSGAVAAALLRLAAAPNVAMRFKRGGALMHLKSYLIDGTVLRGGATNFSASGLKGQDGDRLETDEPTAVAAFRACVRGGVASVAPSSTRSCRPSACTRPSNRWGRRS